MIRRQEFQSIKTHEFVFQDASGRFPDVNSVMAVATDKGIARFTSDLSLNSLHVTTATIDNITVGNQSAVFVDLAATNATIQVLTVDSSATFLGNILYNSEVLAGNVDSTESFMVAVGISDSSNSIYSIRTSVNGVYWNNASGDVFSNGGYGVAWNGSIWVAVGSNGTNNANTIAYSSNGVDWTYASGGFLYWGRGVAWNGLYWIAVGTDGIPGGGRTILTSKDGVSWSDANSANIFQTRYPQGTGTGRAVAWNGQFWVVVGYDIVNSANSIYVSKDGMNWTLGNSLEGNPLFSPGGNAVAWGQNTWIVVGNNTTNTNNYMIQRGTDNAGVSTSDTVTFADIPDSNFRGSAAVIGNGIAWNGSIWLIAASNNKGIYVSSDVNGAATTWSLSTGMTSGSWNGITWNGSIWIAAGDDGIWTSPDGRTWLPTKGVSGITYGVAARKILPNAGYILPKMIPASRNTVDASGMDLVFVADPNVLKHSVILLTVRIPRSNTYPTSAPAVPYNQGRAYVYRKYIGDTTYGTGFHITSYEYDSSTYDYAIIN